MYENRKKVFILGYTKNEKLSIYSIFFTDFTHLFMG